MSKLNSKRSGCVDVFHAFLVADASYEGTPEMPVMTAVNEVPVRVIPFSKAMQSQDYGQWVHFYEDDVKFERFWNQPEKYLDRLSKFEGLISPDFSLWVDMPEPQQIWNTYRDRAMGHWLQSHGLKVIPNVRFSDERSYCYCFNGVPRHATICVGSHGLMKAKRDREMFKRGLIETLDRLAPTCLLVYGTAPKDVFSPEIMGEVPLIVYPSEFALSRSEVMR